MGIPGGVGIPGAGGIPEGWEFLGGWEFLVGVLIWPLVSGAGMLILHFEFRIIDTKCSYSSVRCRVFCQIQGLVSDRGPGTKYFGTFS